MTNKEPLKKKPHRNSEERKEMLTFRRVVQRHRQSDYMWPITKHDSPEYRKN